MRRTHLLVSSSAEDAGLTSASPAAPVPLREEWDLVLPRALLMLFSVLSAAESLASESFRSRGRNLILASQRESLELAVRTILFLIC